MNTLTTIIFLIISFILGIVVTLAVELFFIWLLVFREDKSDNTKTDYDETDDY
jgi:hypothetical protein